MKIVQIGVIVISGLLLASCQQIPTEQSENSGRYRNVTEADMASLFGKRLARLPDYFIVRSDGTFDGKWSFGEPIEGTWNFRDGFWCRVMTVSGTHTLGVEDCQTWERDGNRIRATRDRGNGNSFVYTIE